VYREQLEALASNVIGISINLGITALHAFYSLKTKTVTMHYIFIILDLNYTRLEDRHN